MNIVVLAGGLSGERDVSISSGTKVAKTLKENGHNAILVDLFFGCDNFETCEKAFLENTLDENKTIQNTAPDYKKFKELKKQNGGSIIGENVLELCKYADIVFMALHGEDGENGKIQATFDTLGIKYTGSGYLGSALAMDKKLTKDILVSSNIKMAKDIVVSYDDLQGINKSDITYPCVIKPCTGGSSIGVSIVFSESEFDKAIEMASGFDNDIMIEDYIKGREFSVGVLSGKALPIIEIIPKQGFYDYENKYQAGMTQEICPAVLGDEIRIKMQNAALDVFAALGLAVYARIDFILDENNDCFCLEANTLPGMTPLSLIPQEAAADGISFSELVEMIIKDSFSKYN